jgi:replicative DNA helicase Mcm
LADFLDRYYAEEIAALCQSSRDTLHVEAGDLRLFVDESDDFDTIMAKPSHYADVLEAAVEFCTSTQGVTPNLNVAIVDEGGTGVLGKGGGVPHLGVADVSSNAVREYVGITGQLAAVTKIREFPRVSEWRCQECAAQQTVRQDTREFQEPTGSCNCEAAPRWVLDYDATEWADHRKLKIQQPPEDAANGETQHITAHVFGPDTSDVHGTPLTQRVGEDVVVYGTVELRQQDGRGAADYLFNHYLRAEAVTFEENGIDAVDVDAHRDEVETHAAAADVYERFYTSLAPQIHPTDQMELAMKVCAAYLFGAPRIDPDDGPMYRGDIHAALIGDPGMAKSVLLSGVAEFSPDNEHRSATGLSSDVGLVAAAVDDDFGEGGWTLKPGILVRAGMHAIIDEIDKGPDDLEKINDAMEGRQIASVDKAGMKADLKTRTGVLVSGNPEASRFNTDEPLPPQIDVDESLLTRFDAIVLLIDEVDEQQDREIASHITSSFIEGVDMVRGEADAPDAVDREVTPEVGRAWVTLGRQITPRLTESAAEKLEEFYVDVRTFNEQQDEDKTISATARQLEAGVRFAMAFARMRLSETVEAKDVEMATDVSRSLIGQTFNSDDGTLNIDKLTTSDAGTQAGRKERIKAALDHPDGVTPAEVASIAGVAESVAREEIETFKRKGEAVEPTTGEFRLVR